MNTNGDDVFTFNEQGLVNFKSPLEWGNFGQRRSEVIDLSLRKVFPNHFLSVEMDFNAIIMPEVEGKFIDYRHFRDLEAPMKVSA
jgi:hypothetical protein